MKLYQGKPYWPTTWPTEPLSSTGAPEQCDAAVIGGGISGMLCAYQLARAGYKAVLIERAQVGHGSTSLNTGLIQYMSDALLTDLAETFNDQIANSFYKASWRALDLLEEIVGQLPQNPQFRRNSSLYVAADSQALRQLKEEALRHQSLDLPARLIDEAELNSLHHLKGKGALLTHRDVELNPFQFTRFMAETAKDRYALTILEDTDVLEGAIDPRAHTLELPQGTLHYRRLFIATGYDVFPFVQKTIPQMQLISTFAVITAPLPQHRLIPTDVMVWESARPYLYFRTSHDGRLIAGGSDENNTRLSEKKSKKQADELLRQIKDRLTEPTALFPEFWYEAIFAESRDGLPYMGPHPEHDDIFVLHGIGGNGTVYSAIGARLALQYMDRGIDEEFRFLFPGKKRIFQGD